MIKIISWNINGIRAILKKGDLQQFMQMHNPDILCVQETKAEQAQVPEEFNPPTDYTAFFHSCSVRKGYSGVATFSRIVPLASSIHIGEERFDQEGRVVQTEYPGFTLLNVYFPNGGAREERLLYKLDFYDAFFEYCQNLRSKGHRLIVCGDYNTAHQRIDLARPDENKNTSGFMDVERIKLDAIQNMGFVDTFRMFNDQGGNYTWWDVKTNSRAKNVGWRIDYHWVTEDLKSCVKNAYHLPEQMGSDHCPVVLEIEV